MRQGHIKGLIKVAYWW